jgi:hypothetical protein
LRNLPYLLIPLTVQKGRKSPTNDRGTIASMGAFLATASATVSSANPLDVSIPVGIASNFPPAKI